MCFMEINKLFGLIYGSIVICLLAVLVIYKINMFLLQSLPKMIIDSTSFWVGGW